MGGEYVSDLDQLAEWIAVTAMVTLFALGWIAGSLR